MNPVRASLLARPSLPPSSSSSCITTNTHASTRPIPTSLYPHPHTPHHQQQIRHATLIRRPLRPYTFTQLVTLSDGSTYTQRTTSPLAAYVSRKDTRNTPLWNPSSQKLLNVEADEAGKLKRFREKFGRGWDADAARSEEGEGENGQHGEEGGMEGGEQQERRGAAPTVGEGESEGEDGDNLLDLISGYGRQAEQEGTAAGVQEGKTSSGKGKGGER